MACNQRDNSFQPKKLNKPGVKILKEILRTIKFDEILMNENNLILQVFLSSFIDEMKRRDELFKEMFQKVHYTGSFYSDLQISKPNEFDVKIILKMPFKPSDFTVEYCQLPSYANYFLNNNYSRLYDPHAKLLRKFFLCGYLEPEYVRKWMQELMDKALSTYTLPSGVLCIRQGARGSPRTLQLQKIKGIIDIDLVPVVSCCLETNQPGIDQTVRAKLGVTLETFLIPKPYPRKPGTLAPVSGGELSSVLLTHFPVAENELLHDYGCVKSIIKLLKLLCDKEGWNILASYSLKTVAMWMLLENSSKDYWKEDNIDEIFIEALQKLQLYVKKEYLPYIFSNHLNLIQTITNNEAIIITNRLSVIISDARNDRGTLWTIFCVEPTF